MPTAYSGNGSLIQIGDEASPEVWTSISLQGDGVSMGQSASVIPTTNHNDPDGWETCIMGLIKGEPIPLKVFWDPNDATQNETATGLLGLCNTGTKKHFKLVEGRNFSPVKKWTFYGFVASVKNVYPLDGAMVADISIQPTGKQLHS